jgi:DNA-binding response OmpR family regulator
MWKLLIIGAENQGLAQLSSGLRSRGFVCALAANEEEAIEKVSQRCVDVVLAATDGMSISSEILDILRRIGQERPMPVIALLSREALDSPGIGRELDDFVVEPFDVAEVAARAGRVLWQRRKVDAQDLIKHGDLVIDLAKCRVSLNSKCVSLTFKEYELLKFLASNKGRVFTREALLNQVWGYDYYGGDRTVDVHIRRLRSKLEDSTHALIQTVRNIGYRFNDHE